MYFTKDNMEIACYGVPLQALWNHRGTKYQVPRYQDRSTEPGELGEEKMMAMLLKLSRFEIKWSPKGVAHLGDVAFLE